MALSYETHRLSRIFRLADLIKIASTGDNVCNINDVYNLILTVNWVVLCAILIAIDNKTKQGDTAKANYLLELVRTVVNVTKLSFLSLLLFKKLFCVMRIFRIKCVYYWFLLKEETFRVKSLVARLML